MKLGPVTKLDKNVKKDVKKFDDDVMRENCDVLVIFPINADLEQFRSRISDAQSVKPTFSLIVTFYLTKTENRTKKYLTQLSHYCFE